MYKKHLLLHLHAYVAEFWWVWDGVILSSEHTECHVSQHRDTIRLEIFARRKFNVHKIATFSR